MKVKLLIVFMVIGFMGCSSLKLEPASFGWPLETVLVPDESGSISIERYSTDVNVIKMFFEETEDLNAYKGKEVRVIRNTDGYYFMTSVGFKNVYVFEPESGALDLEAKIFITEIGLNNPAFNQRAPYIELIDGNESYKLSESEIVRN